MPRAFEPQLIKNKFAPLSDYDEVPVNTKLFYENDQKEVFWQYTIYYLVDVTEHGLLVRDTNGIESTLSSLNNLYVMIA